MVPTQLKLKNTVKYPTSLIFGGLSKLGLEITDSLLEQGGYVIIVDTYSEENVGKLRTFPKDSLVSFIDYTTLPHLDEELRRLDYVFFFNHESINLTHKRSAQDFLKISNYIDTILSLATKFEAKFLLTTSIKSHQLNAYNEDSKILNHDSHKTYTDSELQRYSESMVLEYIEKNQLDARIIRLAEIIGDGIDFSLDTPFAELVLQAARGENLKLHKDGLESEWLVHILDAAYGIIKAQFSKNTDGKTYSISYDNSFSHLAIGYKLQEEEATAQEIVFVDSKDNLPSLKLYKPAPNLSTIGWTAKVPFDKAIRQSVASAKIYMLESQNNGSDKSTISNKLRTFFALADDNVPQKSKVNTGEYDGPIARLIAERKKQETLKQESIELASGSITIKKRKKARTFSEKAHNWAWDNFLNIGKTFAVFKNKTPLEFFGIAATTFILVFLFFGLLSPVLVFVRNIILVVPEYNATVTSISQNQWLTQSRDFAMLKRSIDENIQILENFNTLFNFLALGEENTETKLVLHNYSEILDAVDDIDYALDPLKSYFNSYEGNVQLRTSTESYLTVSTTGVDYENVLLDFHDRYPYLETGMQKYSKAVKELRKTNITLIPQFVQQNINDMNSLFFNIEDDISSLRNLEFFDDMAGVYTPKTYLVLLLDNTRLRSIGGEVSAYALFTVKNGSIIEITVKSPEETKFDLSSINTQKLKEINSTKFALKTSQNLTLNDLSSMVNYSQYSDYMSEIFKDTFSREISGVISINYSSLDNLLKILNPNEAVDINNVNFASGDFLQNLSSVQDLNAGIDFKHKITAQLLANVLNKVFSEPGKHLSTVINELGKDIDSKNVLISTPNMQFNKVVKANNYDSEDIINTDSYIKIGYNIDDNKIINVERYPDLNIAKEVLINPDYKLINSATIEYPLLGSSQEIVACIPSRVSNSSIKVINIPSERVTINESQLEKCIVVKAITEREIKINWDLDSGSSAGEKTLSLGVAKVKGSTSALDYKITLDGLITLIDSEPFVNLQGQSLIFTSLLDKDRVINLVMQK